jgi:hypothetical protein
MPEVLLVRALKMKNAVLKKISSYHHKAVNTLDASIDPLLIHVDNQMLSLFLPLGLSLFVPIEARIHKRML